MLTGEWSRTIETDLKDIEREVSNASTLDEVLVKSSNVRSASNKHFPRDYCQCMIFAAAGVWPGQSLVGCAQWVHLWDLEADAQHAGYYRLLGHFSNVETVLFQPDGARVITASLDGSARLWSLTSSDPSKRSIPLRSHTKAIRTAVVTRDGRWLITGSTDATIRLWPLRVTELVEQACRIAGANLSREAWEEYVPDQPRQATCPSDRVIPALLSSKFRLR